MGKKKNDNEKKEKKVTTEELEDLRDQLARALADYDNLRKRVEKEKRSFKKIANYELVSRLLPVFDMLIEAKKHVKDAGLGMIISEFTSALKEEGVVKIGAEKGDKFNEELHEAVEAVEGKGETNTIAETTQPGWRYEEGLVIRPAKVKVYKEKGDK